MEELMFLNALKLIEGVGSAKLNRLVGFFGSAQRAWQADCRELVTCLGQDQVVDKIVSDRQVIDPLQEWHRLESKGIRVTAPGRVDYPLSLCNIYQPPPILYYQGDLRGSDLSIAIVGSRSASPYGRYFAKNLAMDLVKGGMLIVSGLARGIDAAAHMGALDGGGRTIAVLGCGLDTIYPKEHLALAKRIITHGAVISEFPLETAPLSANFPVRNRIIAGLSLGTLVVEGKAKSGSLITADFALEQGRDVFALPGPVNADNSRGPHKLLKQGAKLVESAEDIFEEYVHLLPQKSQFDKAGRRYPKEYKPILDLLSFEPVHLDKLCHKLSTSPEKIAGLLVHLELAGLIRQVSGGYYVINFS